VQDQPHKTDLNNSYSFSQVNSHFT